MRVLPLQGCAGSDSSASDDEPEHRSGSLSFRVVRPFFVRGGAESMESGGQSSFALHSDFAFGARIDHASHTLRCRRPVPVRRFPFRNSPAGLFHIGFFWGWAVEMWTILSGAFGRASVRAWIAHIPTAPSGLGARAAIRHPVCGIQGWRDLHKALAITTSLRATAAATSLCGFPSFRSRSAKTFKSAL